MFPRRRFASPLLHGLFAVLLWLAQIGWVAHAAEHLRGDSQEGLGSTHLCAVCVAAEHAAAPPACPPALPILLAHPAPFSRPSLPVPALPSYGLPEPRGPPAH